MQLKTLISYIESIAPPSYQESYDNAGLIVGNAEAKLKGVLICLDSTEAVIDEAIKKGCNLVLAHHPIVFFGLKRFNGSNYVERVVMKAIKHDIAIYAAHTNLDNVYNGVNAKIADKLGLVNCKVLLPKQNWKKLSAVFPVKQETAVRQAILSSGAGRAGEMEGVTFSTIGAGSSSQGIEALIKMEVVFHEALQGKVISNLKNTLGLHFEHYEIFPIENSYSQFGSGMIGELIKPVEEKAFLRKLKKTMKTGCIRHTHLPGKKIKKVAVCGGAGGFLLKHAIAQGAQVFVTSDFKYHEFFDAEGRIIIADIGHYESEQFTIELFEELIREKFSNFAVHLTKVNTNPIRYC